MTVRQERIEQVVSKISEDHRSTHIYGIPGMGKSEFLDAIERRLGSEYDIIRVNVRLQDDSNKLFQDLLTQTRDEAPFLTSNKNKYNLSLGAGLGPFNLGGSNDDRVRSIQKLKDLLDDWGTPKLVVVVEDIDNLDESEYLVRDVIDELDSVLGGREVPLVTSGEIGDTPVEEVHLNAYTPSQTREFLENKFPNPDKDDIEAVHRAVDGHPLYLKMIADSAEELENIELPAEQVYEKVESLYLDNLSPDQLKFLRRSSPLPQLDPNICGRVLDDFDQDQSTSLLQQLDNNVIVRSENRTDRGYRVYHIHNRIRKVLIERVSDEEQIRRNAFLERVSIISDLLEDGSDETVFRRVSPHAMLAARHLEVLHEEVTGDVVYSELDKSDISIMVRLFISILILSAKSPNEIGEVVEIAHNDLSEVVSDAEELNTTQKRLITSVSEYIAGKLDNSIENKALTDISIAGDLDELPGEEDLADSSELDISQEQREKFIRAYENLFKFFFIDEPYSKKTYRKLLEVTVADFGISPDVVIECAQTCRNVLEESDAGKEFADLFEDRMEIITDQIYSESPDALNMYMVRDLTMDLTNETIQEFLNRQVIDDGIIANMALEGGKVLEEAENPIFSIFWYNIFLAIVQDRDVDSSTTEALTERYQEAVERRKEFEKELSDPIVDSADLAAEIPDTND